MPLTSIRTVPTGKFTVGYVPAIGDQIYRYMKTTPKEYHDVFSHPEKIFSMRLMNQQNLRRILIDIPGAIDTKKDYFIDFAFNNGLWDIIPVETRFTMDRWNMIRNIFSMPDPLVKFVKEWMDFHLNMDRKLELFSDLMFTWKTKKWTVESGKKRMIAIAESFFPIGSMVANSFKKQLLDDEKKDREKKEEHGKIMDREFLKARILKPKPVVAVKKRLEDLHTFSERTVSEFIKFEKTVEISSAITSEKISDSSSKKSSGYYSESEHLDLFDGGATGYGSYECGSDDDTISPEEEDDDEREAFVIDKLNLEDDVLHM